MNKVGIVQAGMITEIDVTDEGIIMSIKFTPDKDGMIQVGPNAYAHIDEIKKALEKHGISYLKLPGTDKGEWYIQPPPSVSIHKED